MRIVCWVARVGVVSLLALLLIAPSVASAHEVGLSRGDYRVDGDQVTASITMAGAERELLAASIVERTRVASGGADCVTTRSTTTAADDDGVRVAMAYRCDRGAEDVTITLDWLEDAPRGHRHMAFFERDGEPADSLLHRQRSVLSLAAVRGAVAPAEPIGFVEMVGIGVEHILLGVDHLVFLLGLVLVGRRVRSLATMITAFTLGHSVTLGLAVLGVYAAPPSLVEPAIALSIAYVGIENYLVKDDTKRWRIALLFGLIHGFGFAGALGELSLPAVDVPSMLVSFNLGVELGQLAVMAVVLPLIMLVRNRRWYQRIALPTASAAVTLAGLFWFGTRVLG